VTAAVCHVPHPVLLFADGHLHHDLRAAVWSPVQGGATPTGSPPARCVTGCRWEDGHLCCCCEMCWGRQQASQQQTESCALVLLHTASGPQSCALSYLNPAATISGMHRTSTCQQPRWGCAARWDIMTRQHTYQQMNVIN